jgi:hypothetical protein
MKQLNNILILIIVSVFFVNAQNSTLQIYLKYKSLSMPTYEILFCTKDFLKVISQDSLNLKKWIDSKRKHLISSEKKDEIYNRIVFKAMFDTLSVYNTLQTNGVKKQLFKNFIFNNISKDELKYLLNYVTDETFVQESILFVVLIFKKEEYFDIITKDEKLTKNYNKWLKNPHPLGITANAPVEIQEKWKVELTKIFKNSKYKIANESLQNINW